MNRRLLIFLAKLVVTGGLLILVLRSLDIGAAWRQARELAAGGVFVALALVLLASILHSWRWLFVFRALGERVGFGFSLVTVMIGVFFNQTLPSAIGGDAVRLWRVHRRGIRFGHALYAVLLDRGAALIGLLAIMVVMLPDLRAATPDAETRWSLTLVILAGVLGFFVFLALDKMVTRWRRWRLVAFLADMSRVARRLFGTMALAVPVLAISMLIHVCLIAAVFALFRAQHAEIAFWHCATLMPLIILVSMVPISIAGWGVREGAMVVAFGWVGAAPETALLTSLVYGAIGLVCGIPGGLLFLAGGRRRPRFEPADPA
ncbi:MAG: YbhN family protein [Alphaproteobacteria bacterium]